MNKNIKIIDANSELLEKSVKRDCFNKVSSFIDDKRCLNGKILALYGLRRTGKSFLLSQIKAHYGDKAEHLEFPLNTKDGEPLFFTMKDVYNAIDEYINKGKTIILLDEITNVIDFTYDSEILADYYAKKGISIIIAGTDSLGLILAGNGPLLGRKPDVPMTYISFAEHSRIFNTNDIDDYIKYGGLMHEGVSDDDDMIKDYTSMCRYLNSAVSGNITRSLMRYVKYNKEVTNFEEIKKYTESDIQQIINKFVEDYSGHFDESKINIQTIRNNIDYPLKKFTTKFSNNVKDQINNNRSKINAKYAKAINIKCNLTKPASEELINELRHALVILGVASSINTCVFEKIDGEWSNSKDYKECHIIQPAIKYYQLEEARKIYMETSDLSEMKYHERVFLSKKLDEKIFGEMTEAIVQFDTKNALDLEKYFVCKPRFSINGVDSGEYDMLIYNTASNSYYGFEIKHTDNPYINQYKNLENQEFTEVLNAQFGKREQVCVLYRGKPFKTPDNKIYLNISDFLKTVDEYKDINKVINILTQNLPQEILMSEPSKEESEIEENKEDDWKPGDEG